MPKEQLNYNHYQMYEIRFYFRQKYIHEQTKQTKIKGKKGRKKEVGRKREKCTSVNLHNTEEKKAKK